MEFDLIEDSTHWEEEESDFLLRDILSQEDQMSYLNSADYNLNSPLISDDMVYLIKRMNHEEVPPIWRSKEWDSPLDMLKGCQAQPISHQDMHNWFGTWIQNIQHDSAQGFTFLKEVDKEAEMTYDLVSTFIKGWVGKEYPFKPKGREIDSIALVGPLCQKFLDLHKITLILNAVSLGETKELLTTFKGKYRMSCENIPIARLRLPSLGPVFMCKGWTYIHKERVLMDRNFLLMCKDVIIGRMQTFLSMIGRSDNKFSPDQIYTLANVYRIGDQILEQCGNKAYDLIKMIEPICNLKMMELARLHRPKIPKFPHFEEHVKGSVRELTQKSNKIQALYDLIMSMKDVDLVLVVYGSFRHWGHPFIDYFEGLEKLHTQVNMEKHIDKEYPQQLASDLARLVLHKQFSESKKWFVDPSKMSPKHPFYEHVVNKTWPTAAKIQDFGDNWHKLPLTQCFEIPDLIDPSVIYSDKSHSMNKKEVMQHVRSKPNIPIPSKKVLQTMLTNRATNWKAFLKDIDENGLDDDDLIIGLKGKERELKIAGRFFSLMSWRLREYFVITEYLIKTYYVPLFKGLTMADDLTSVIKKMMDSSSGQGLDDYSSVCLANHIDYEKWNNHQRKESNGPIFRVMGQFLGYPSLIERTHEFFEKSLIYYNGRPDLMTIRNSTLCNSTKNRVCWNGQKGGLEGLRQKGWSIVNLLVIQREAKIRNTAVKVLAQGDNQVICTQYKTKKTRSELELRAVLHQMAGNNNKIMEEIKRGTEKLGLIINDDETMQSADYLNYGKIPIFRGVIRGLETKRWSRVTCVTNDQIPTCANLMSSVSTNALTVAHFAENPINAMIQYNYFGTFARLLLFMHDPAIRQSLYTVQEKIPGLHTRTFKYAMLYLDPSIGGVCGMALSRFLIRAFPDPVTESLSFWKFIYEHASEPHLKKMAVMFGDPPIARFRIEHINKLLEDPTSLNISMGMSPANLLKSEVKKCLIESRSSIKNEIVKDATIYMHQEEEKLRGFLWSIKPLFPRFLSEFKAGTFLGVSEGLINLFQNSRTIRNSFKRRYHKDLDELIIKSEISSLSHLGSMHYRLGDNHIWSCSASRADVLRYKSWTRKVVGTTVPHPLEMHGSPSRKEKPCQLCNSSGLTYISVHCPKGITDVFNRRGPLPAYLGSNTSESTSILQPWEKESKIPIIKRATRLRDAISWFIPPESPLSMCILNNIRALTGEDWSSKQHGFKRTGSALHRFSTSRMSNGGFASQSPATLTRMIATTDTMRDFGTKNYDFMFQASLLYGQMTTSISRYGSPGSCTDHYHIRCKGCIREIEEVELNTSLEYKTPDVYHILEKWRNNTGSWGHQIKQLKPAEGNWESLSPVEQSYQVARCIGFLYGELTHKKSRQADDSSLFPLSIQLKVRGRGFLRGLLDGLMRSSCCQVIHRRSVSTLKRPANAVYGGLIYLIDKLSASSPFLSLVRTGPIRQELEQVPHKMSTSYPTNIRDLGSIVRNYFKYQCRPVERGHYKTYYNQIWLFSDVLSTEFIGPMAISSSLLKLLYRPSLTKKDKEELRELAALSSNLRSGEDWDDLHIKFFSNDLLFCPQEIRHACKFGIKKENDDITLYPNWGIEYIGNVTDIPVFYRAQNVQKDIRIPPRIQNPLMSGLRLGQLPTGAHYKMRTIISRFKIPYHDFLACGDGSGGMTAALLRLNRASRGIFNSLLDLSDTMLRGSSPEPPSALETLGGERSRCVNGDSCWEHPSDLSDENTWKYFLHLKKGCGMSINLITMDMEVKDPTMSHKIELLVRQYVPVLLESDGCLIYKTYGTYIATQKDNSLTLIGSLFHSVQLVQTDLSSSNTSELYLVCRRLKDYIDTPFVDWIELYDYWENQYAFKDIKDEFHRARSLKPETTLVGIPPQFIPDPGVNLETLFQIAGVPTGVAHGITHHIMQSKNKLISNAIGSMCVISHFVINTIRTTDSMPGPPSDGDVNKMCSALIGTCFWLSWIESDLNLYKTCLRSVMKSMPVRWFRVLKNGKWFQKWDCKGDAIPKDSRLGDSMANIGNWIRAWELIRDGNISEPFDATAVEVLTTSVDKSLSWKKVLKTTGIPRLLNSDIDVIDQSILNVQIDIVENQAWQN
nr:polymerase [Vesicular stomatitis virus]